MITGLIGDVGTLTMVRPKPLAFLHKLTTKCWRWRCSCSSSPTFNVLGSVLEHLCASHSWPGWLESALAPTQPKRHFQPSMLLPGC